MKRILLEAAVAVILRDGHALLVRRAARSGDPWSGHMAFPGGRRADEDADLVATAMREAREEIGLSLERAAMIGALPPVYTVAPARDAVFGAGMLPMIVRPYVFAIAAGDGEALTPNAEVTAVRWVRLEDLRDRRRRTTRPWRILGVRWPAPAWDIEGDVIWGLTHRMLRTLLASRLGRLPEATGGTARRRPDDTR